MSNTRGPRRGTTPEPYPQQQYTPVPPQSPTSARTRSTPSRAATNQTDAYSPRQYTAGPPQNAPGLYASSPPQSPTSARTRSRGSRGAPSRAATDERSGVMEEPRQYTPAPPQNAPGLYASSPPQSPTSARTRSRSSRGAPSRTAADERSGVMEEQRQYTPAPPQNFQQYAAVPSQSPQSARSHSTRGASSPAATNEGPQAQSSGRGGIIQGVATGVIGADYGPYSYDPNLNRANPGDGSRLRKVAPVVRPGLARTATVNTRFEKNLDLDDELHNPDPVADARLDRQFDIFSSRGWSNATALFVLFGGLIALFAGFPLIDHFEHPGPRIMGFNLGGINGSGQVPQLTKFPKVIDEDTPSSAYTHNGADGKKYNLVFSDEFNVDGRTFYPGDDPYFEAVDLHYWPTGDLEWYDPSAITTKDGKLVITMSEMVNHNLNFQSGMLQTWNKLCFTTGYIEVSISLPGHPSTPGFWPGAWVMGNLGRAGYGATTEGMWPYSYDSCDLGTFPNQTTQDGKPTAVADAKLSFLPGQRLSACTCPGSDHPGPSTSNGRGVPEIDILEAQVEIDGSAPYFRGQASQSYQTAPYNLHYEFDNTTASTPIVNGTNTFFNSYKGNPYQQTISGITYIDDKYYSGNAYQPYGMEWYSNPAKRSSGYINWLTNGEKRWTLTPDTIGPDSGSQIAGRLITEEPMYLVFNLGMSPNFQHQDFKHLQFPAQMLIDYVRVYQLPGTQNGMTCDPPQRPTADYIERHLGAYSNPNLTTWAQAGYTFPRNSLYDGC